MFPYKFTRILILGALAVSLGNTAFAVDNQSASMSTSTIADPFGSAAPERAAERIINLEGRKYVNVTQGETIKFTSNGKTFAWNFDTLGTPNFDLSVIAPKDVSVGKVRVYVAPDELDRGG